mmetsp:Transcript_31253/g.99722  ORF Transcript_31253/g.99722 Transcript_31253/m.99722 type:complete len:255 (+) Transcript_31253:525-1289(+)
MPCGGHVRRRPGDALLADLRPQPGGQDPVPQLADLQAVAEVPGRVLEDPPPREIHELPLLPCHPHRALGPLSQAAGPPVRPADRPDVGGGRALPPGCGPPVDLLPQPDRPPAQVASVEVPGARDDDFVLAHAPGGLREGDELHPGARAAEALHARGPAHDEVRGALRVPGGLPLPHEGQAPQGIELLPHRARLLHSGHRGHGHPRLPALGELAPLPGRPGPLPALPAPAQGEGGLTGAWARRGRPPSGRGRGMA